MLSASEAHKLSYQGFQKIVRTEIEDAVNAGRNFRIIDVTYILKEYIDNIINELTQLKYKIELISSRNSYGGILLDLKIEW